MKCPFETPVEARESSADPDLRYIASKNTVCFICGDVNKKYANYIVHAINSHEKLTKIMQISYEAICTGDQEASDKAIGLIEDYEQALKEAE